MSAPTPVALIGVGLMGASLGLALRERTDVETVIGVDPDQATLAHARRRGAVTDTAPLAEAVSGAGCVVLAAPVTMLPALAAEVLAASDETTLVTDLGSTKERLMGAVGAPARRRFIGGHPVCGGEHSGPGAARADLFVGATWFLTPGAEARADLYERLHRLVGAVGALPTAIGADVHDRLMAVVSHLPHVLATALVNHAADSAPEGREALRSAGPSFRDLTRVAGSNPELWADILLDNRAAVLDASSEFRRGLEDVEASLARGDRDALVEVLTRGRAANERLRAPLDPDTPSAVLTVAVPDRPGALSAIATALGHAHINIEDLALRPGPPGGVGVVRLVLAGESAAANARVVLAARGFELDAPTGGEELG